MRLREWSEVDRTLLVSAIALAVLDLAYPVAYALNLHAYNVAPKNSSFAPEDDLGFFGTGLLAGGVSLLRDVAVVVAVVGIVLQARRLRSGAARWLLLVAGVSAFALEVLRFVSEGDHPSGTALALVIAVCGLNILALGAIMQASRTGDRSAQHGSWPPVDLHV